jgi:hypothetical protein
MYNGTAHLPAGVRAIPLPKPLVFTKLGRDFQTPNDFEKKSQYTKLAELHRVIFFTFYNISQPNL